ncbi:hypothetical protein LBMAG48_25710 [Phycisphaerae bacterium]|jgi:hypothetical protein|nr:hypothetical protein LBMAG48_25710 [Phycisphaerae bacterium]
MATGKKAIDLNAQASGKHAEANDASEKRANIIKVSAAAVLFVGAGLLIWNSVREVNPVVNPGTDAAPAAGQVKEDPQTYQGKPIPLELQGTQPVGKRWIPPPDGSK